jgi:hypothetical protein
MRLAQGVAVKLKEPHTMRQAGIGNAPLKIRLLILSSRPVVKTPTSSVPRERRNLSGGFF